MSVLLTRCSVDEIPNRARVCHYDELGSSTKEQFSQLIDDDTDIIDDSVTDGLRHCEYVKYVDYYEVSRE